MKELGVTPIARFVGYKAVGVDPKIMGIGPAYAIPEVLSLNISVEDIDLIELNEAFASQTIASIKSRSEYHECEWWRYCFRSLVLQAMLTARLLNEMVNVPIAYGMV